jgi:hypothetical protein
MNDREKRFDARLAGPDNPAQSSHQHQASWAARMNGVSHQKPARPRMQIVNLADDLAGSRLRL